MVKAELLIKGQNLKVNLDQVKDRLPKDLVEQLTNNPYGRLVGFKMVDGNSFGLVLKLADGNESWFFEKELSEVLEEKSNQ